MRVFRRANPAQEDYRAGERYYVSAAAEVVCDMPGLTSRAGTALLTGLADASASRRASSGVSP